jgi:uncharacterized protein YjiS (DUF1127 family)
MTLHLAYETHPIRRAAAEPGITTLRTAPIATLHLWLSRWRERKELLRLDNHMLEDIGIDRRQAQEMAARPFWRA